MAEINHTILENIDTEGKAYLLGWIARTINASDTEHAITIAIDKEHIKCLRILRDSICENIPIITEPNTPLMKFSINSQKIYQDACSHLQIKTDDEYVKFPTLENETLTWSFIRGYYESDSIRTNTFASYPTCCISSKSEMMINSIGNFCKIPNSISKDTIAFCDTNCIDFCGKLYSSQTNYKLQSKYDIYVNWLTVKPSSVHLPEAYIFKTDNTAVLPSKSKTSDVGYDLSIIKEKTKLLNNVVLYDTGIQIRVEHGLYAEVVPRSSLSKSGYMFANSIGIIDPSYNGNLFIALIKIVPDAEDIKFPFRCCQIIFRQQYHVNMKEVSKPFDATARGEGGFGSTGI